MGTRRSGRFVGAAALVLGCSNTGTMAGASSDPSAAEPSASMPTTGASGGVASSFNVDATDTDGSRAQQQSSVGPAAPSTTDRETTPVLTDERISAASNESSNRGGVTSGSDTPSDDVKPRGVTIVGRSIFIDGQLFHIKGVNWNPVGKGNGHPDGLDYAGYADQDIALMKAAGINAVRTYERLEDTEVLDKLHAAGIYVFSTVLGWWQDDPSVVTARVETAKDHPAILAWVLGNEWNYNQLYSDGQLSNEQVRDKLNQAAALIKAADPNHPVATIYGELGDIEIAIGNMPDVDIWGINAYRGKDHAALFTQWQQLSTKPMFLGEYGADAWDSRDGGSENLAAQAEATTTLTQQLIDAYTTSDGGGVASGGFIFEWADEWWKAGDPATHDNGGEAPGGGPYPDGTFNEEWWGIVDIDRTPRPAYEALKALYL